jgi:hypothetical protein
MPVPGLGLLFYVRPPGRSSPTAYVHEEWGHPRLPEQTESNQHFVTFVVFSTIPSLATICLRSQ